MLNIEQLEDFDYIMDNLPEIITINKASAKALDIVKTYWKNKKESYTDDSKEINYTSYNKYSAKDIDKLLEKYPLEKYPDMYSLWITAKASEYVMEDDLLDFKPIEKVSFKLL